MRIVLIGMLSCLLIGCGGEPGGQIVPFEEVPEAVLAKAKEKLPNVKFESAVRRSDGGLEVRGKDPSGNVRDVEFSVAGDVIEVE